MLIKQVFETVCRWWRGPSKYEGCQEGRLVVITSATSDPFVTMPQAERQAGGLGPVPTRRTGWRVVGSRHAIPSLAGLAAAYQAYRHLSPPTEKGKANGSFTITA
jgi:hypothetical protein